MICRRPCKQSRYIVTKGGGKTQHLIQHGKEVQNGRADSPTTPTAIAKQHGVSRNCDPRCKQPGPAQQIGPPNVASDI